MRKQFSRTRRWAGLVLLAVTMVACTPTHSTTDAETSRSPFETTEASMQPTSADPEPTAEASAAGASTTEPTQVTEAVEVDPPPCRRLTDFDTDDEQASWFIVNDNVMGGRSDGEVAYGPSLMRFSGAINTDGGGFASVRAELSPGVLVDASHLVVRARTDGRAYRVTLSDEFADRDPRISHQGLIEFAASDEWQETWVPLADLSASLFGRSVDTPPFDLATASEIGIILSDGLDGPFSLDVDWIDVCS